MYLQLRLCMHLLLRPAADAGRAGAEAVMAVASAARNAAECAAVTRSSGLPRPQRGV
eukprot:CAMPEP_0173069250 /NCGR_PEP_ID=MMETSP1102-20130122/7904_1 /TAXON_ID=49646 /ORGANISM="Geminigera sp., Strain Caron Lab Isolate" /LENGTH=56 /DNA_ID=CAMNT_0013937281 /DNA_START=578 /DNA_END=748 /DNA_ORIENTATION=+